MESVLGLAGLISKQQPCLPASLKTCILALGWGPRLSPRACWAWGAACCLPPQPAPTLLVPTMPSLIPRAAHPVFNTVPQPGLPEMAGYPPSSRGFPLHSVLKRSPAGHPQLACNLEKIRGKLQIASFVRVLNLLITGNI